MTFNIEAILRSMLAESPRISDLNFTVGRPPQVEIDSALVPLSIAPLDRPLTAADTRALAETFLGGGRHLRETLEETGSCDGAYALPDGPRFRVNIFTASQDLSIVLRVLPNEVPNLASLQLPETVGDIPELINGLVLVTGATGSGKSTTLAAIVDAINNTRAVHVVTLEDPVEFLHQHKKSTINQRELGVDFDTFAAGLRASLRQAPKVILVGEMRDRETVEIALKAAETGHLVLSTLHTIDAGQTINRIVGLFEHSEQALLRNRLAQTLRYVIGQRLVPRVDEGRVAIQEIMGMNLRIRELILQGEDSEKTFYQVMAESKPYGMQTFDHHIVEHFKEGAITREMALAYCTDESAVNRMIDNHLAQLGENTSDLGRLEMLHSRRQGL